MSLVTPRKTFLQTSGTVDINVEDFSSIGVYIEGTVTISSIRMGAKTPAGNFLRAANETTPTANTPTIIDVKGADLVQIVIATTVTGNNGVLVVGQINKVSNE